MYSSQKHFANRKIKHSKIFTKQKYALDIFSLNSQYILFKGLGPVKKIQKKNHVEQVWIKIHFQGVYQIATRKK